MGLYKWLQSRIKKLTVFDVQLIKTASFLFGLAIGALLAQWLLPYWWVLVILAILAALAVFYRTN